MKIESLWRPKQKQLLKKVMRVEESRDAIDLRWPERIYLFRGSEHPESYFGELACLDDDGRSVGLETPHWA